MILLPSDARFDLWRSCGSDKAAVEAQIASATTLPPGEIVYNTQLVLNDGEVLVGSLDAQGNRLTKLMFTKSLFDLLGQGTKGPIDSPGYSYPSAGGLITVVDGGSAILANVDLVFPEIPAMPHHYEPGFHGPFARGTSQLLLYNLGIWNADNAMSLGGLHSHVWGATIGTTGPGRTPNAEGKVGHYGVTLCGEGQAVEDVQLLVKTFHDFGVQGGHACAFLRCRGVNMRMDFHRNLHSDQDDDNLYYDLDVGAGTDIFPLVGKSTYGPWAGHRATFHKMHYGSGTPLPLSKYPSWLHAVIIPDDLSETLPPPPGGTMILTPTLVGSTLTLQVSPDVQIGTTTGKQHIHRSKPDGSMSHIYSLASFTLPAGQTQVTVDLVSSSSVATDPHPIVNNQHYVLTVGSPPPPPPPDDPKVTAKQKLIAMGLTQAEADVTVNL